MAPSDGGVHTISAVLVKPLWSIVFCGDPQTPRSSSILFAMAWHLDEVFVRINGKTHYLWRAVDHEGEGLEVYATKRRDHRAALEFLKQAMKRYGRPASIVTDRLRSYRTAMKVIGTAAVGSTTGRKARIGPCDDGTGRWRGSETSRPCRNSPPSMPRFTTIATTNAISTAALFSNKLEPPPWPNGVNLQPESSRLTV